MGSVRLHNQDLRKISKTELFTHSFAVLFMGFIGFALLSFDFRFALLTIYIPTIVLTLWTLLANYFLRKLATLGFVATFSFQQITIQMFFSAILFFSFYVYIAAYYANILTLTGPPEWLLPSRISLGLSVLLYSFSFLWVKKQKGGVFDSKWTEGGLCIFQFLRDGSGFWLRKGLKRAEEVLQEIGISVSRGTLKFAASYCLVKGIPIDSELRLLAHWMRDQRVRSQREIGSFLTNLLTYAKEAESLGFKKPPTVVDYLSSFRWQDLYYGAFVIIGTLTLMHTLHLI